MALGRAIRVLAVVLAIGAGLATVACTPGSRTRGGRGEGRDRPAPADPSGGGGGEVFVSDAELAPMDQWVKQRRWILGDQVEIDASREYFGAIVSIATRIGFVKQEINEAGGVTTTTLTFLGRPEQVDVQTAPRVLVGTGLTVTARRSLTLRLHRTTNPDLPVRFRLVARGKASTGSGDLVAQRGDQLGIGASLRRLPGGGYAFEEQ